MDNLATVIGLCVSIASFYVGRQSGAKKEGERTGRILSEIAHVNEALKELKKDIERIKPEEIHSKLSIHENDIIVIKDKLYCMNEILTEHIAEHKKQSNK